MDGAFKKLSQRFQNMNDFVIKPATPTTVKPLIGLFGLSGGGKTRSALILARGLVGPAGKIRMLDTEGGRGSLFANKIPGGYEVAELSAPFSPARYVEALNVLEPGADCIVIDSLSHEWSGEGGVLEMHEAEMDRMAKGQESRREAMSWPAWRIPKTEHKLLIGRLLRMRCAVIFCMRATQKSRMTKEGNFTKIVTDEHGTEDFDQKFLFEVLCAGEVFQKDGIGGFFRLTKRTLDEIGDCLPKSGEQIKPAHGEALAHWCANMPAAKQPESIAQVADLKQQIWNVTMEIHNKSVKALEQHLWDENFMSDTERWKELPASRLAEILDKLKARQPVTA